MAQTLARPFTIACVLRSGGDFTPEHVRLLKRGAFQHFNIPGCYLNFICLTDMPVHDASVRVIPLSCGWPGWWSKMELFRRDIEGDLLYFDLDTVILGDLTRLASVNQLTLLRDFYRPKGLGSGMMYLPAKERAEAWQAWIANPAQHMRMRGGDQRFLETLWLERAARWQDLCPGEVLSYKADVRKHGNVIPAGARVLCFHGTPRPWNVQLPAQQEVR